jgi:hypothetical protein
LSPILPFTINKSFPLHKLSVNNFNDLSEKLNNINPEEINQDFINTCTSDLCHLFISAAKNTFGTRSVYKGKPKIVKVFFKVFMSSKKLKSSLYSISGCLVDFPVFNIFQYSFG